VSWQIPSAGDTLDSTTGHLDGAWSGGTAATISATGGASVYAAGTGTYVRWLTGVILDGRKFIGRTFLAPLAASCYDTDGTIGAGFVTTIQTATNTLVGAGKLSLYHRPQSLGDPGSSATIIAGVAVDRVTSLRSRRS